MKKIVFILMLPFIWASCSTQQKVVRVDSQIQPIPAQSGTNSQEKGLKRKVAIARFSNETQYAKGVFYNKDNDPLGKQALDILSTKLASTNKFILLERADADKIADELKLNGADAGSKIGADYLIIGSVTEFGRKNTGDVNMFSRSKSQIVQAGVSLRLIDVATGQIIYSEEGKGEAETTNKTVLGLGEQAGYDATLSDKAISAAITKLVENVINNCMDRPWKSYFINVDENGILISGGKSQGIHVGDSFDVFEKGKIVKNPQTGMNIELPGKKAGTIRVITTGGDNVQNEYSVVNFTDGSIDKSNPSNYIVKEIK